MTADVELLPLPRVLVHVPHEGDMELEAVGNYYAAEQVRANVAHATAAKDAEIEALRAEVETRKEDYATLTAMWRADEAKYVARAESSEARAERLAEALVAERDRWAARKADAIREQAGGMTRGDPGAVARCDAAIQRIDAALHPTAAQEGA